MFRKHFRIRRFVLGLAFAAFAVPVAPAAAASLSTFVDGGPAPVSFPNTGTYQPSYLRYHEVGVPVATMGAPTVAVSERSNGVKGPDPSLVPQIISSTSTSFDWQDAGIGASTAFGVALLLIAAVALGRRRDQARLTNA